MSHHDPDPDASPGAAPDGDGSPGAAAYERQITAARLAKDDLFRHPLGSPLSAHRRKDFRGLRYFPPDEAYRFPGLRLEPLGDGMDAPFTIDTSDDRPRTAYRLGRLSFVLHGRALTLTAYRLGEASRTEALFVPFRDRTSGIETYAAGRYLDIEAEPDGSFVVDFNLAYNPLCAYSDAYSCPLPPAENRLPVRVAAGERFEDRGHGG